MSLDIRSLRISIADADIEDLRERLRRTRWPEAETINDRSQGAQLERVKALCEYWLHSYDWRVCEAKLNDYGVHIARIDNLDIAFLHIRSSNPDALPLIMTHGWPGSVVEFFKVIEPLTEPAAHNADMSDSFHLVLPMLPGYGFSEKPSQPGWNPDRVARAWAELMPALGYGHYVAQGGDWGAAVTTALARAKPSALRGIHLNLPLARPDEAQSAAPSPQEQKIIEDLERVQREGAGYLTLQATRPQTIGYSLVDSPAGLAAWIYEKLSDWTDNESGPEQILSLDEMLDNIMLYWLPAAGASAARLYWEGIGTAFAPQKIDIPVGVSIFPKEIMRASRRWAENVYTNLIHWNELDCGGHFPAFEQPALFASELRDCFRQLR